MFPICKPSASRACHKPISRNDFRLRVVDCRALADNAAAVSRSLSKRLLVIAMLLCKLVTGQFMFVAMAEGAPISAAATIAATEATACPEHAHSTPAHEHPVGASHIGHGSDPASHHSGQCTFGCKCSCTHTPASVAMSEPLATPTRFYVTSELYTAPAVSGSRTPLFRPPI